MTYDAAFASIIIVESNMKKNVLLSDGDGSVVAKC